MDVKLINGNEIGRLGTVKVNTVLGVLLCQESIVLCISIEIDNLLMWL